MFTDTFETIILLRDVLKITTDPSTFFLVELHNTLAQVNNLWGLLHLNKKVAGGVLD